MAQQHIQQNIGSKILLLHSQVKVLSNFQGFYCLSSWWQYSRDSCYTTLLDAQCHLKMIHGPNKKDSFQFGPFNTTEVSTYSLGQSNFIPSSDNSGSFFNKNVSLSKQTLQKECFVMYFFLMNHHQTFVHELTAMLLVHVQSLWWYVFCSLPKDTNLQITSNGSLWNSPQYCRSCKMASKQQSRDLPHQTTIARWPAPNWKYGISMNISCDHYSVPERASGRNCPLNYMITFIDWP